MKLHHRLMQQGYLAYSRFARGMTIGVRAMLIKDDAVLLVKHRYLPGWYLPGGGVEAGESVVDALTREVQEETGAALTGPAELFAIYRHPMPPRRDHVVLYICRNWLPGGARKSLEIVAAEMFPLARLPNDAVPSTIARLREVMQREPPSKDW